MNRKLLLYLPIAVTLLWAMFFGRAVTEVRNVPPAVQTLVAAEGMVPSGLAWHGSTEEHADCSGWNVDVDTRWTDDDGNVHVGEIVESHNLSGSWTSYPQTINWSVKVRWATGETWRDSGSIEAPFCPTNTPVPTATPTLVPPPTATNTTVPPTPIFTPTVTNTTVPPRPTPTPTAAPPTEVPPTEELSEEVVEVAAVAVEASCALEPVLREFWNADSRQWDILWFEYDDTAKSLTLVRNQTLGVVFNEDFRNPTIRRDNCAWAAEVRLEDGRIEVRTYDFAMRLLGVISNPSESFLQPEFVQLPGNPMVVVTESNHQLIKSDQSGKLWEPLPSYGQYPHSLTFDGRFILAYTQEGTGNLAFVTDTGQDLPSLEVKCDRPEWRPDGNAVYCRVGFDLMVYSFPEGRLIEVYEGFFATALDPDNSGRGVMSGSELLFVENILASPLQPEMLNSELGWGSDWGDLQVPADLTAFETRIEALGAESENGGPTSVEPVCSDYAGNSLIDCLLSAGMNASFEARAKLAAEHGITDYVGSSQQNTELLELLKGQ